MNLGGIIALLVLVLVVVFFVLGQLSPLLAGFLGALALSRLT